MTQREREREGDEEGVIVLAADWVRFVGPSSPPSQEINNTYIHTLMSTIHSHTLTQYKS